MALQTGKVPWPGHLVVDRYIADTDSWSPAGPRNIVGTCIHRMDGPLGSADYHFRDRSPQGGANGGDTGALTDFGIGGILEPDLDGMIYQWNDPFGNRAPWANGPAREDPQGYGLDFLSQYVPEGSEDLVNRDLVSIELSGWAGVLWDGTPDPNHDPTPMTPKQFESLCWLVAFFHDSAGVPHDAFPINPALGVVTCLEHREFAGKECPFSVVIGLRERYFARVKEIMKHYQTGKPGPHPSATSLPGTGDNGTPNTGRPANFQVNDKIKVAVGNPINLRAGTSTATIVVSVLQNGAQLCVLGGPVANEGYKWYEVQAVLSGQIGHVAGELCDVVERDGCDTGSAPALFSVNDRIKVATDLLNVRSSPGTSGGVVDPKTMQPSDAMEAASRGIAESAIAYARRRNADHLDDVVAYVNEVYRLAAITGIDAAIVIAQSAHETDAWSSYWWNERLNPAGIGITGDPVEDGASQTFATGVAAARGQIAHLHAYVYGNSMPLPADLQGTDARYQAVFDAGYDGTAHQIQDLTGKWAVDPTYHDGICDRGNAIFGNALGTTTPSSSSMVIGEISFGTELCVLEGPVEANGYQWFRVDAYGLDGWVAGNYCSLVWADGCSGEGVVGKFRVNDRIQVLDGPLNLRQAPTTEATILGTHETGTHLCVIGGPVYDGHYEWHQVPGGWVAGDFCGVVRLGGCAGGSTPGRFTVDDLIRVFDGPLNLRSGPSLSAAIIGSYETGDEICVTGGPTTADGYEWYQVPAGWVAGDFCSLATLGGCGGIGSGRFSVEDRIYVADGPLNVRAAPTTAAAIIGDFAYNTEMCVIDGPIYADDFEWYRVSGGIEGWVAGDYCGLVAFGGCRTDVGFGRFSAGDRAEVADGPINVRSAPALGDNVVDTLGQWSDFCLLEGPVFADGHDWYRIDAFGLAGWVAGVNLGLIGTCGFSAASLDTPPAAVGQSGATIGDTLVVARGAVALRSSPSPTASVVADLIETTPMVIVGGPTTAAAQVWRQVETRFGRGWVPAAQVSTRGTVVNYLYNGTADLSLVGISAINSRSEISRELIGGNYAVRCVNSGVDSGEGMKYASQAGVNLTGAHIFCGIVDVLGAGMLDDVRVRLIYTDGTSTYSPPAPSVTLLADTWQRVVTPPVTANAAKTVDQIQLRVRRSAAIAMTFHVDNGRVHALSVVG